ncbi:MAG TPA: DUF4253 domain-containing protein [Burkholderiaceae bacterium]
MQRGDRFAAQAWQVSAILNAGDWNDYTNPAEHLAFFKRRGERYGERIVSYGVDVVEFVVARPHAMMAEAEQLAHAQFIYRADIVHQGVVGDGNLATLLPNAENRYFRWD